MRNKQNIMSLLVFLVIGLPTSSFFLADYLTKKINENKHSIAQLDFALELENLAALRFAWNRSSLHGEQWLMLSTKLAKTQGDVAYQLALFHQDKPAQAIFWYKSAVRLKYQEASIALAQLYFQQDKLNEAAKILAALPEELSQKLNIEANLLKVNIAINRGDLAEVSLIISKHAQQLKLTTKGLLLLTDIEKYQLLLDKNKTFESSLLTMSCDNSIQLFATNIKHLKHTESLIENFKEQVLNQAVCFLPVRYMPINALDCSMEQDKAIRCNELNWQPWARKIDTRYVGLMLPKGGANVHLGILYFDAQDGVDVVAHEISHLLGFIDEYPLVADHIKCRSSQNKRFAQNISVLKKRYQGERGVIRTKVLKQIAWAKHIKKATPILQPVTSQSNEQYWQLGTPNKYKDEVGLFDAQTCDNSVHQKKSGFSAFKPLLQRTKLQYFALGFPELYSTLIKDNSMQYLMPSFHYNIALAYFQQAPFQQINIEKANYWLGKAASWEREANRRKRIRLGEF